MTRRFLLSLPSIAPLARALGFKPKPVIVATYVDCEALMEASVELWGRGVMNQLRADAFKSPKVYTFRRPQGG